MSMPAAVMPAVCHFGFQSNYLTLTTRDDTGFSPTSKRCTAVSVISVQMLCGFYRGLRSAVETSWAQVATRAGTHQQRRTPLKAQPLLSPTSACSAI